MRTLVPVSSTEEEIWQVLAAIPTGKVATYGQIAKLSGHPGHARFVGYVLKNLPKNSTLPWHRVINAKGRLSFPPRSEAYRRQISRLQEEGIQFKAGRISLREHQWQLQPGQAAKKHD